MITFFRQLNAVLGLIVAPLLFVLVMSWAILTWFRHGRDPIYLDDPSIHIPAPPPGLTPAAGATIRDGKVSRRALTAASLDLAVRGLISFEAEDKPGILASGTQIGIHTDGTVRGDPSDQARIAVGPPAADGRRHGVPAPPAAGHRRRRRFVHHPRGDHQVRNGRRGFEKRVEEHCVRQGWFVERPTVAKGRWVGRAVLAFVGGIVAVVIGANLPSDGLALVGAALVATEHRPDRDLAGDARRDEGRLDDPGDARGLPADAREDDGAGALDGRGRRRSPRSRSSSHPTTPSRGASRSGSRTRSSACSSARPRTPAEHGTRGYVPLVVRAHSPLPTGRAATGRRRHRARAHEQLADPELRRDDGRARHDRELARLLGLGLVAAAAGSAAARPAAVGAARAAGSRAPGRTAATLTVHSGPWEPPTRWKSSSSA